jgi:hypothetical protein
MVRVSSLGLIILFILTPNDGHAQWQTNGVRGTPASGLALTPNHPNPFSATTTIDLDLRVDADVAVDIFDVGGRLVRRLGLGRVGAGPRRVDFDGLDADGRELPSGVYFYRVHANGMLGARKMVIAR